LLLGLAKALSYCLGSVNWLVNTELYARVSFSALVLMLYLFLQAIHDFCLQKVIEKGEDGRGGTPRSCFGMQHLWVPLRCP